jgi:hypothetical protein
MTPMTPMAGKNRSGIVKPPALWYPFHPDKEVSGDGQRPYL